MQRESGGSGTSHRVRAVRALTVLDPRLAVEPRTMSHETTPPRLRGPEVPFGLYFSRSCSRGTSTRNGCTRSERKFRSRHAEHLAARGVVGFGGRFFVLAKFARPWARAALRRLMTRHDESAGRHRGQ